MRFICGERVSVVSGLAPRWAAKQPLLHTPR